jgi:hypothetical protein
MPTGCASEMKAQFSDTLLNGKTHDLSALGMDVTDWQDIDFIVKNKNTTIRINGTDVFSTRYNISGGLITGLGFISNGLCEIDHVELTTLEGQSIYKNDFTN